MGARSSVAKKKKIRKNYEVCLDIRGKVKTTGELAAAAAALAAVFDVMGLEVGGVTAGAEG